MPLGWRIAPINACLSGRAFFGNTSRQARGSARVRLSRNRKVESQCPPVSFSQARSRASQFSPSSDMKEPLSIWSRLPWFPDGFPRLDRKEFEVGKIVFDDHSALGIVRIRHRKLRQPDFRV